MFLILLLTSVVPTGPVLLAGDDTGARTPRSQRVRQGTPSRWRALTPQLYGVSVGACVGRVVGTVKLPFAMRPWALPVLVALVQRPRLGSSLWDTP
jgi:hypothetical protein